MSKKNKINQIQLKQNKVINKKVQFNKKIKKILNYRVRRKKNKKKKDVVDMIRCFICFEEKKTNCLIFNILMNFS